MQTSFLRCENSFLGVQSYGVELISCLLLFMRDNDVKEIKFLEIYSMPPGTNKICRVKFIKLRHQSLIILVIGASRIMKGVENFVTLSRIFLSLSLSSFLYILHPPSPYLNVF